MNAANTRLSASPLIACASRVPYGAASTEAAATRLTELNDSLVGQVRGLEAEVDALLSDLTAAPVAA